nr:hypothetical protein [Tanacetum cinerariifolium]
EVVEVVTTAKLITDVVTAATSQVSAAGATISAASATISAAKPSIPDVAPTVVAAYTRRRKGNDEICTIVQARFDANIRFLFKSREEMEEEDQEVLKSINETLAQKAAKRRKLNKEAQEVEDLKKRLEVVDDEDDDVFTEATPLARKTMFEKPDGQDAVWKSQRNVHGLALLLELILSKRSRKNTKCANVADEELTAAKHKLMLLVYCC